MYKWFDLEAVHLPPTRAAAERNKVEKTARMLCCCYMALLVNAATPVFCSDRRKRGYYSSHAFNQQEQAIATSNTILIANKYSHNIIIRQAGPVHFIGRRDKASWEVYFHAYVGK